MTPFVTITDFGYSSAYPYEYIQSGLSNCCHIAIVCGSAVLSWFDSFSSVLQSDLGMSRQKLYARICQNSSENSGDFWRCRSRNRDFVPDSGAESVKCRRMQDSFISSALVKLEGHHIHLLIIS
jgi:hypothetical protein